MNPVTIDIRDILTEKTDLEFGKTLFISAFPPNTAKGVCIYDQTYSTPETTFDGKVIYQDGIQIVIRNIDYVTMMNQVLEISEALHGVANTIINGTKYLFIKQSSGPFLISYFGVDTVEISYKDKLQISMNFLIKRTTT